MHYYIIIVLAESYHTMSSDTDHNEPSLVRVSAKMKVEDKPGKLWEAINAIAVS